MSLPIYVDIDGTLTTTPESGWGPVIESRLSHVKHMLGAGYEIVMWSARGSDYARQWCQKAGLENVTAIGKPAGMVDDNPTIRPPGKMVRWPPELFFGEMNSADSQ